MTVPTVPASLSPSAVILAAGRSTRMGRTKALLPWGDRPLLTAWIERFQGAGAAEVAVVLGAEFDLIRATVEPSLEAPDRVRWVQNADPARTGPRESLLLGLDSLPADSPAWFTPVDVPVVRTATLRALLAVWLEGPPVDRPLAAVPRFEGSPGHPVLAGPAFVERLFQGEAGDRIDQLLAWASRRVVFAAVPDPRVVQDMDDVEAYQAAAPAPGAPDPLD